MIQAYMSQLHCDEETSEFSSADEPYVLVVSVNLAAKVDVPGGSVPIPASDVFLYGPYEDVDDGDNRFADITQSFWGVIGRRPDKLDDPENAIFIVQLMEHDEGSPGFLRSTLKGIVAGSLSASLSASRPDKLDKLLHDVNDALDPAIAAFPLDDKIGLAQELRFSREELSQAQRREGVLAGPVSKNLVFSGEGGRYTLTFKASGVSRYRSFNFQDHFIRHSNFLGELNRVVTDLDRADSLFELAPGLKPGNIAVSLRSMNFPDHFLRHQNGRLKLQKPAGPNDELFKNDATFLVERGFADSRGVSFRSFNFRDRFIRHRDFHLFVEAGSGDLFAKDSTFLID